MMSTWRSRSWAQWRALALTAMLGGLASCNQPQAPAPAEPGGSFAGSYHPSAGTMEFALDPSGPAGDGLRLEAVELHYDLENHAVSARVRLRNAGALPVPGPDGILVLDFAPQDVRPLNTLSPCDGLLPCPPFVFDHRGSYGEDGVLAPGESSEPREWRLQNPSGESFAFRARPVTSFTGGNGVIAGAVFADENGDGRRDPFEAGIAGATIQLLHGETAAQTQSDASGAYRFTVLEEGLYQVMRTADPGCQPTTASQRQIWIVRRPDGTLSGFDHADFGCRADTTLPADSLIVQGVVYLDSNRNGRRDPGEAGVPNVRVSAGSACAAPCGGASDTMTDEQGRYRFLNPSGCCRLEFVGHDPVFGHVDTTPNPVQFRSPQPGDPTVPPGLPPGPPAGPIVRVDFGVAPQDPNQSVHITGVVFEDLDRDGQRGSAEPGIAGVLIIGSTPTCPTFAPIEARTDEQGRYAMELPQCGPPYIVQREPLNGFIDTTPNPVVFFGPVPGPWPPMPPVQVFDASFGVARSEEPPAPFIEGVVFDDRNRNGIQDADEPGVADVGVTASSLLCLPAPPGGTQTRTGPDGRYRLNSADIVCPMPWTVQRDPVDGFCDTTPNPVVVVGPQGGATLQVDFGIAACDSTPPVSGFTITGTVFLDANHNGVRDRGEPGVPGAKLLLLSNCNALWTAQTNATGDYRFTADQTSCPIQFVQLTEPAFAAYTTPNPAPVLPPPSGEAVRIDFGVMRRIVR